MAITVLGTLAALLTVCGLIPQILKTLKTRSATDLSWYWLIFTCTGWASWVAYGVFTKDMPVLLANISSFLLGIILIFGKIRANLSKLNRMEEDEQREHAGLKHGLSPDSFERDFRHDRDHDDEEWSKYIVNPHEHMEGR